MPVLGIYSLGNRSVYVYYSSPGELINKMCILNITSCGKSYLRITDMILRVLLWYILGFTYNSGLTGGLAAPLVAAGAGALIGGAGAAALGSAAGVAIIGSLFGVAGAGLTGKTMGK